MNVTKLQSLKETVDHYGLKAKKSLGQNFIFDTNLLNKIVKTAKENNKEAFEKGLVVEIGPGPGGLTRSILENGANKVLAIEKDERAIGVLKEIQEVYPERLEFLNQDALEVDLLGLTPKPCTVVANLPYNVATPLLIGYLKNIQAFSGLTLMFQKEVAQRIVAQPKTKAYGRLAILAQWLCDVEIAFDVHPSSFTPPPKVYSSVVVFRPKEKPLADVSFENLEKVTKILFQQRRKMIRHALKEFGDVNNLCQTAGITETSRAEELPLDIFLTLAKLLET